MNDQINYKNNPLNGVGLKQLINELVDHYGFEILYAYLNINCFKTNPSIESAIKFLKKTQWAREKVEGFYLYEYKSLPKASKAQFELAPRDRIVPDGDSPGEPAELSLEDAEQRRASKAKKAAQWDAQRASSPSSQRKPRASSPWGNDGGGSRREGKKLPADPWGNFKK